MLSAHALRVAVKISFFLQRVSFHNSRRVCPLLLGVAVKYFESRSQNLDAAQRQV